MDKRLRELEEEQRRLMEQMEKNESKNKYKYKSAEKHESNILYNLLSDFCCWASDCSGYSSQLK